MNINIDGGCPSNGSPDAIAASAAVIHWHDRRPGIQTTILPTPPTATSQRAELNALVLALEAAVERKQKLRRNPYFQLYIKTDSRYVEGCMNQWRETWESNG